MSAPSETPALVRLRPVREYTPTPLDWLWPSRLALGKLAILDGDPGLGKSLVALDIRARPNRSWRSARCWRESGTRAAVTGCCRDRSCRKPWPPKTRKATWNAGWRPCAKSIRPQPRWMSCKPGQPVKGRCPFFLVPTLPRGNARISPLCGARTKGNRTEPLANRAAERPKARSHAGAWEREKSKPVWSAAVSAARGGRDARAPSNKRSHPCPPSSIPNVPPP